MTVHDFFVELSNVDWLYAMSDAPGVYARGRQQVIETKEKAKKLGEVYMQMYNDFDAYYSGIVTGADIKKPEVCDYES